ncbi:MAG TPA: CPXCG motif-containing cysteine-rich protein [Ignavibacteria bacterium]|jgi:transcription elongation factor Elf1
MEYFFNCPYCGEKISLILDLLYNKQSYIEDCEVCCNSVLINFETDGKSILFFEAIKAE